MSLLFSHIPFASLLDLLQSCLFPLQRTKTDLKKSSVVTEAPNPTSSFKRSPCLIFNNMKNEACLPQRLTSTVGHNTVPEYSRVLLNDYIFSCVRSLNAGISSVPAFSPPLFSC